MDGDDGTGEGHATGGAAERMRGIRSRVRARLVDGPPDLSSDPDPTGRHAVAVRPHRDGALSRMARRLPDTVLFQLTTGPGDRGAPRELLFVGGNAGRIVGMSAEAILADGRLAYGLIHPADRNILAEAEADALRGNRAFSVRVRGADRVPRAGAGGDVMFDIAATPTPLGDGRTLWDGTVQNVSERVEREAESERWRGVVEAADDLIATVGPGGTIETINPAGRLMLGLAPDDPLPDARALWPRLPDGTDQLSEAVRHAARGAPWRGEAVLVRPDGTRLPVTQSLVAHRVPTLGGRRGRVTHFSTIMRDVSKTAETERALRLASEMATVELREMGHRVKNVFALISSVIQLSSRSARSVPALAEALRGRVASLARSHEATIGEAARVENAEMGALARAVLSPYAVDGEDTFALDGPEYRLGAASSSTMGLVLHELATNAVKYGALSGTGGLIGPNMPVADRARGRVELTWRSTSDGGIDLLWSEGGGPPVRPPQHDGFGTALIDRIVIVQGGEVSRLWNPAGLSVRVRLPAR